jgi:peptide-methionine (S)-S-oxide reductase
MQVVFQHVKGVKSAISGYTGGSKANAIYELVSTGITGHAESVQITLDPSVISYGTILRIYFSVAADPAEPNYQAPDHGTQYRGQIWAENMEKRSITTAYLAQLAAAHIYSAPIVTRIDGARPFYLAEGYHQNYATLHPDSFYILANDAPKVAALAKVFRGLYQSQLVLLSRYLASCAGCPGRRPVTRRHDDDSNHGLRRKLAQVMIGVHSQNIDNGPS